MRIENIINSITLTQDEKESLFGFFPDGVVVLDLETTGLSPLVDKIIEISAVKFTPSGVEVFDELVNPKMEIPQYTIDIHGIQDHQVADKATIDEVLPRFLDFCGNLPLIAHNAKFDTGFLVFDMHQNGIQAKRNKVFCTIKMSRFAFPKMKSHKLGNLCKELEIPLENHHRALDDAVADLMVLAKCLKASASNRILKESYMFQLRDFRKLESWDIPDHLKILLTKIEKQQVIEIKYKGGTVKNKERPIRPISLLPMPGGHVLYAHCLLSNIYKSFALRKISHVKELNAEEIKYYLETHTKKFDKKEGLD
tara:strand:- start:70528 stop:71457 length:930 start_codon:yes stop_codon:yes gene_type:complete